MSVMGIFRQLRASSSSPPFLGLNLIAYPIIRATSSLRSARHHVAKNRSAIFLLISTISLDRNELP
jgi:hypothetical protein